ncbi:MAG: nicotinic acid mononucleotide adenylyltransferase [Flavobacteriales bacterium CG_4_10_14_0_2_um_filter_32_8]|nr:MAG: nicotinic acid mononucleotide adenylyltransferase [Flavobacteriales bacterium CG_4_10_14_0_2_um_filter_32_8]PJB14039.1 MAG: nicotinic acid mononucleotide adenylyltransferase [Flavobacteriales bacterium CG_4_9_14_3_um_filter_32_8]
MNIGLYFGTFNPIHVGHLVIANHMVEFTNLDQVWLVVTPQNPLKNKTSLLADYHRLATVRIAVEDNAKLKACNIEFDLPKPSYTINTLVYLKEKYPEHTFSLIMGEDNLRTFHKWKNYEQIIENYPIYSYPRVLTEQEQEEKQNIASKNFLKNHPTITICKAPVMNISASFIREAIKNKKDVRYLLTESVYKYVTEMHFYEK